MPVQKYRSEDGPEAEGSESVAMTSASRMIDAAGFEAALQQLERTVEDLESGELGLDGALAKYELGVRLLTHCYSLLDRAERIVALLDAVDESGQPLTSPFDVTATARRDSIEDGPCA
jgi:exodeoxyribonuclease VII small subunit